MTGSRGARLMLPLGVTLAAGLYFSIGIGFTLEWADEGQIVYPSWRVARGAVPHQDFQHLYGPSLFLVNGALLRVFGADLGVLRISMVLLKAGIVLLTFLCARRVSSAPIALAAAGLLVAVWGAPVPFFSTPYASYYGLAMVLGGLLWFLSRPEHPYRACLGAGLCFGIAATFKQTTGLFPYLALLVYLAVERPTAESRGEAKGEPAPWLRSTGAILQPVVLLLAFVFTWAYVLRASQPLNALMLGGPLATGLVLLSMRELRQPAGGNARAGSASRQMALTLGASLPLLACGLYYLSNGQLGVLVSNTITELPRVIGLSVPLAVPDLPALLWCLLGVASVYALRGRTLRDTPSSSAHRMVPMALAVLAGSALLGGGILWGAEWGWRRGVERFFSLLPLLAAWSTIGVVRNRLGMTAGRRAGPEPRLLFFLLAATGLLYLHPAGDVWHLYLALPVFLPGLAGALERAVHGHTDGALPRPLPRTGKLVLAGLVLLLAWPYLRALESTYRREPNAGAQLERATGVRVRSLSERESVRLIDFLRSGPRAERPLVVLTGQPMVYFLADRVSPIEESEFVLYLIGFDLIDAQDARRLVDQEQIVARIEATRALLVEDTLRSASERVRRVLPVVGRYVDANYRVVRRFGRFRVLERQDSARRAARNPP